MMPHGAQQLRDQPIGVFDSGLGGLTVVREIGRALPGEDIVYLGDTARVPYGTKSLETVRRFSLEAVGFLLTHRPKLIVVACNTASAAAIEVVRRFSPVEVVDVVGPGAAMAVEQTDGPIGVMATESTIDSGAYQRAIEAIAHGRRVIACACPLLVPIVEEGRSEDDPIVLSVLSDYLREMQRERPGALILGCTHYPLLAQAIGRVMGPDVRLINSGHGAAIDVQRRLGLAGLSSTRAYGGRLACFTTDKPERFIRLGERFGHRRIDSIEHVSTDHLETLSAEGRQP